MARRLMDDFKKVILQDNSDGKDIPLWYRDPTTDEWAGYTNSAFQRVRNKVVNKTPEARLKYGRKLLQKIRPEDWAVPASLHANKDELQDEIDDGYLPISSDPESKFYDPKWKDYVCEMGRDLVMLMAAYIFDQSAEIVSVGEEADEEFEKN